MMKVVFKAAIIAMTLAGASVAEAKKITPCGSKIPSDVRDAVRALDFCMTGNDCTGLNAVVFNNNQKRLPSIGHNQQYYEGRVGEDRSGGPGKRRLPIWFRGRRNLQTRLSLRDISQPITTKLSAKLIDVLLSPERPPAGVTSSSGGKDGADARPGSSSRSRWRVVFDT